MKSFADIAEEQGWNDMAKLAVAMRFIHEAGHSEALAVYAQEAAAVENTEYRVLEELGTGLWYIEDSEGTTRAEGICCKAHADVMAAALNAANVTEGS